MWLDRLSGHSTPAATPRASPPLSTNRSYSPAPRRQSLLSPSHTDQRPGIAARSSTRSPVSNNSTTSLLASSRLNGSGLKQSTAVVDIPDPLKMLKNLLESQKNISPNISQQRNDTVVLDARAKDDFELELDFGGLSLREIAEKVTPSNTREHLYNVQSIEDCRLNHMLVVSH